MEKTKTDPSQPPEVLEMTARYRPAADVADVFANRRTVDIPRRGEVALTQQDAAASDYVISSHV